MDFYSPLRYPGGKGKVADYFKQIFKDNFLYDGVYIEPYAGGASVGLSLLFNEYASKIIINDIDKSIFSFWYSVLNETDKLCQLINDANLNIDTWMSQREIQKNKENHNKLELGFSTFFLNRTNRSGIIKAGVIGGKNQDGNWKMDARFNKKELIKRIERIANYRDRIDLYNSDAVKLVNSLAGTLPEKSLFYFDPPYFVKGKELYMNHYNLKDHIEISKQINLINKQRWVVSYDNIETIRNLYIGYKQLYYNLNYSAGGRIKGQEVIIFSDNLIIPDNCKLNLTNVA